MNTTEKIKICELCGKLPKLTENSVQIGSTPFIIIGESPAKDGWIESKRAFYNTKQLKSVIIPNSVKTLDKRCFEGCSNLSAVYLGEGVEKIYEDAFKNCEELSRIVIGKNIETIFDTAFLNCEKLEFVNINNIVKWCNVLLNAQPFNVQVEKYTGSPFAYGADLYQYGKKVENFVLPSEPLYVRNSIFENCTSIKTLTVPSIFSDWRQLIPRLHKPYRREN